MADSPTLNQTMGRRREERAAEQLMQDSVNRLSNIAIDGLEVWQNICRSDPRSPTTGAVGNVANPTFREIKANDANGVAVPSFPHVGKDGTATPFASFALISRKVGFATFSDITRSR